MCCSVERCLDAYGSFDRLSEGAQYLCTQCQHKVDAIKFEVALTTLITFQAFFANPLIILESPELTLKHACVWCTYVQVVTSLPSVAVFHINRALWY